MHTMVRNLLEDEYFQKNVKKKKGEAGAVPSSSLVKLS